MVSQYVVLRRHPLIPGRLQAPCGRRRCGRACPFQNKSEHRERERERGSRHGTDKTWSVMRQTGASKLASKAGDARMHVGRHVYARAAAYRRLHARTGLMKSLQTAVRAVQCSAVLIISTTTESVCAGPEAHVPPECPSRVPDWVCSSRRASRDPCSAAPAAGLAVCFSPSLCCLFWLVGRAVNSLRGRVVGSHWPLAAIYTPSALAGGRPQTARCPHQLGISSGGNLDNWLAKGTHSTATRRSSPIQAPDSESATRILKLGQA